MLKSNTAPMNRPERRTAECQVFLKGIIVMDNQEILQTAMMFEKLDPEVQEELLELMRMMVRLNGAERIAV